MDMVIEFIKTNWPNIADLNNLSRFISSVDL